MVNKWTLRELAADTGVPERTIRFYISRELLDPPLKGGRSAAYGLKHKARLEEIKKLQAKGMMLVEIGHALALENSRQTDKRGTGRASAEVGRMLWYEPDGTLDKSDLRSEDEASVPEPLPVLREPIVWRSYPLAPDVVVMLRAESSPWRTKRLLSAMRQFAGQVKDETKKEDINE